MPDEQRRAQVYVLAGTNGAGKSSVTGAGLTERGLSFFNPDAAARAVRERRPGMTITEANAFAWQEGQRLLLKAIEEKGRFAFETTLGGHTVARRLEECLDAGGEVRMWFVGLETVELHLQRVSARVAAGGHDIPEADIRRRFTTARENLVRLLPKLTELQLYDNSREGNPEEGESPELQPILHTVLGHIVAVCEPEDVPEWAKPIVMAALKSSGQLPRE